MLYSEIKRETLSHIMQYSHGGSEVAEAYNNQADYLNRIPQLINEALVAIRTSVKPDPVVYNLTDGETYGHLVRYELPDNFWALKSGGLIAINDHHLTRSNQYVLQGRKSILVPRDTGYTFTIEYYRYPDQLPMDAEDTDELNEELDVIQAATYYAASKLVLADDEFMHIQLKNEYEERLGRMSRGITVEIDTVQDVYSFGVRCY